MRRADLQGEAEDLPAAAESPPGPGPGEGPESLIVAALRRGRPLRAGALCRETGVPRRTAQRALARLVREGGVQRSGKGPATRYSLSGSGMLPARGAPGRAGPRAEGSRTEPVFEIGEGSP